METKIQMSLKLTNTKNTLLMVTNQYVLMINLLSLLNHHQAKMLFTTNFISSMIEKRKYCNEMMKKHFNKELVMTRQDNEDFENSTKCWICDNNYIDTDVKVRDHCQITGKYIGSARKDCSKIKSHKITVVFYNLKYDASHLIMQELGKFNLTVNVILNGLEKYMSFNINNKLSFIDSFQFLSSSLDSLVKNLRNDDFKYLIQEFYHFIKILPL